MKLNLLAIALIAYAAASAQQVSEKQMKSHLKSVQKSKEKGTTIWDLDTVYKAGVPYCIVVEKSNGALRASDFSVQSLQGKELIYVKYAYYKKPSTAQNLNQYAPATTNVSYYEYYFTDTKNKAEISYSTKVYKTVAEENLIEGDHINSAEEDKFVSLNGKKFSEDAAAQSPLPASNNNNSVYDNLVVRNRNATITIRLTGVGTESGAGISEVTQDNKVIGKVESMQYAANGIIIKILNFYLTDGTKIAQAQCNGINSHEWSILTLKNNLTRSITSTINNDAIDVAKYLTNAYYL